MSDDAKGRPRGVGLVAWSWIVLGALTALLALLYSAAIDGMKELSASGAVPGMPDLKDMQLDAGSGLVIALHYVFAIAAIAAGIQFLKLRAWARTMLEILSWVSLVLVAVLGVVWMVMWNSITLKMLGPEAPTGTLFAIGLAVDVVLVLLSAVPLWMMIRFLRSAAVRGATARQPQRP